MTLRTAIILAALSTTAAHAEKHYFGGHYQCRYPSYINIGVEYGASPNIEVWIYNRHMDRRERIEGSADSWSEKGGKFIANYSGLSVEGDKSTWLNRSGNPDEDCTTFTLVPKEKPLTEYDNYLKLLKEASSDDKGMTAVNAAEFALPPAGMLPDLDRTAYSEQVQNAQQAYWNRAREERSNAVYTLPIEGDGKAYIDKVKPLFGIKMGQYDNIASFDYNNWRERLYPELSAAAYRLAIHDAKPQLMRYSDEEICSRTEYYGRLDSDRSATFITGVPFPFWDREFTQPVIDNLRKCEHNQSANWIIDNFPKITAAGENYRAVSDEIKTLLNKPDTYAAFVETNGLQIKPETREKYQLKDEDIENYSTGLLTQKREKILAKLGDELPALIDAELLQNDYSNAPDLCNTVLPNRNDYRAINQLYQTCTEIAPARIIQITLDKAVARAEKANSIEAASAADWLVLPRIYGASEADIAAAENKLQAPREHIAALIKTTAEQAIAAHKNETIASNICPAAMDAPKIILDAMNHCTTLIAAHNDEIEKAQCDAVIKAAGKAYEIADADIHLAKGLDEKDVNIREFICGMRDEAEIEISGSSWFGRSRTLILKTKDKTAQATITLDKNGVWTVSKVSGKTPKDGISPAACLWDGDYCE